MATLKLFQKCFKGILCNSDDDNDDVVVVVVVVVVEVN
jgi:hypothetical protein